MKLEEFEDNCRKLVVKYTCKRGGGIEYIPLKKAYPDDGEPLRLSQLKIPADWSAHNLNSYVLCPECTKKFAAFLKGEY